MPNKGNQGLHLPHSKIKKRDCCQYKSKHGCIKTQWEKATGVWLAREKSKGYLNSTFLPLEASQLSSAEQLEGQILVAISCALVHNHTNMISLSSAMLIYNFFISFGGKNGGRFFKFA